MQISFSPIGLWSDIVSVMMSWNRLEKSHVLGPMWAGGGGVLGETTLFSIFLKLKYMFCFNYLKTGVPPSQSISWSKLDKRDCLIPCSLPQVAERRCWLDLKTGRVSLSATKTLCSGWGLKAKLNEETQAREAGWVRPAIAGLTCLEEGQELDRSEERALSQRGRLLAAMYFI